MNRMKTEATKCRGLLTRTCSQWFLNLFQRARIARFISFSKERIPADQISRCLPEILDISSLFGKDLCAHWLYELNLHNQAVSRASQMLHAPTKSLDALERFRYQTLDEYILFLHSDKISEALEGFSVFADRLLPSIEENKDADSWRINTEILIHRHHWFALCKRVVNIVKLVGHFDEAEPGALTWPGQERLSAAAQRAAQAYGPFADPDSACPSLPRLLAASASALPDRRNNAKRVRLN